jgi:hypothetical protein
LRDPWQCQRSSDYPNWAREHSALAESLPTVKTARGHHVYFRSPRINRTETLGNGELKGNGYAVLPPSRHESGTTYFWTIPLGRDIPTLDDPSEVGLTRGLSQQQRQTPRHHTLHVSLYVSQRDKIASAIQDTLPTGPGQRNRRVFDLALRLKVFGLLDTTDPAGLREILLQWHRLALPMIRTKPFDPTWRDFRIAANRVKALPVGLPQAIEDARRLPMPLAAAYYDTDGMRLLVAVRGSPSARTSMISSRRSRSGA